MNSDHPTEIDVDSVAHTVSIHRVFAAPRALVWNCFTQSELLDRWFAPKGLIIRTSHQDFREGGHWHYVMIDSNGGQHWVMMDYERIVPLDRLTLVTHFSNEVGERNSDLPSAHWTFSFREDGDRTQVATHIRYASAEAMALVIRMGMLDGMRSMLDRLDEQLPDISEERPVR